MAKTRIYELARKLKKTNKDVISCLEAMGVKGKTHSSTIEDDLIKKVEATLSAPKPGQKAPEKKKPAAQAASKRPAERPKAAEAKPEKKLSADARAARPRQAERPPQRPPAQPPRQERPAQKTPYQPPSRPPVQQAQPPKPEQRPGEDAQAEKKYKVFEDEKAELSKVAPEMKRAFQAIRKLDQSRRHAPVGFKRPQQQRERPTVREQRTVPQVTAPRKKTLKFHEGTTVKEFAELIGVKASDVIKKFMELGYMPTINQPVDTDAALLVADGFGIKLEVQEADDVSVLEEEPEDASMLRERPPIVTIMGHVDHGKTSLLDAIRETKVIDTEAGGITQHIGAYKVTHKGRDIVFLDTPGHEAFTALRARGAKVTDIVVLIVAADDGVKPQTIEAVDHAKAANVPIIVAINKIDKPEADPKRVRNELAELGIISEEWGGQNIFAEISAKKRIGIEQLLELIQLQAEVMELKANPESAAKGVIIESRVDKGKGPVATVVIQKGRLSIGDSFISGTNFGKVRALFDDSGRKIKEAGPATPLEIIGFSDVPNAGDTFAVVEDEKRARQLAMARLQKQRPAAAAQRRKLTLEDLYSKIKEGHIKELNIIIKGDVQGSVEALRDALTGITHPEVQVKVIHSGAGGINESDVTLAMASEAIIIGFNVRPDPKAAQVAEREGVDIELYNVIYEAIDDVKKALEGMLEPTVREKVLGRAEVRQVFHSSKFGNIAGCYVLEGSVSRNSDGIRVVRDNIVVYEGKIDTLKRFKDDVREVQTGYECGITIANFNDIKAGDVLENFVLEKVAATL